MVMVLSPELVRKLEKLYADMEAAYDGVAQRLEHSCNGCPDNCCDSYFLHHTYLEWAYLWQGLGLLSKEQRTVIIEKAYQYERESKAIIEQGDRPGIMCPLNEAGKCVLYSHRFMVCRTHGVPASLTRPDGKTLRFPGCFRCQESLDKRGLKEEAVPVMERTQLLRRLAMLEQRFLEGRRHLAPRVKKTIASMLSSGPPELSHCSDLKDK